MSAVIYEHLWSRGDQAGRRRHEDVGRWCGLEVQVMMVMRHLHNVVVVTCLDHLTLVITFVAPRSHGNCPGNCP